MEKASPLIIINLLGYPFEITFSLILQWIIICVITITVIVLTRNLKKIPDRKQAIIEIIVDYINKLVNENMGEKYKGFIPFIGTLVIYLLSMNLMGLFGVKPPTTDYNVALGLSIISFIIIQAYTIKKVGLIHYFIGYAKPVLILLPINIVERIALPISLSLRLFGNMFAATIIMELVYQALRGVGFIAQIGLPIPLHAYFDIFDGTLQMIIFIMLTMINIKVIAEH